MDAEPPFDVRYPLGYDTEPCRAIRAVLFSAALSWNERRARDAGERGARCGASVAVHRFDSARRWNVPMHAPVLDGVFVGLALGEKPTFAAIDPPDSEDSASATTCATASPPC